MKTPLPILVEQIEVHLENVTTTSAPVLKKLFAELKTYLPATAVTNDAEILDTNDSGTETQTDAIDTTA